MKLRARQERFVNSCVAALTERGNTLGVAPTGAGKTVMLSAIGGHYAQQGGVGLVLQHRDELVTQNRATFRLMNPAAVTSVVSADSKRWSGTTFAMVQTLARANNRAEMPKLDWLAVDEGHHAAAKSYRDVISQAQDDNPNLKLLLVTATPNRGDGKSLKGVVDNVADQITLKELIEARLLVRPRTFVIDTGITDELAKVKTIGGEADAGAVEEIMDKDVVNEAVIEHWLEKAPGRQTVFFCSTVQHAIHVTEALTAAGIRAVCVDGNMSAGQRADALKAYDRGEYQCVVNVAILTEGWDHQPTSCVVLLRKSSYQSTMMQMIGRGLRIVDPERYPGVFKDDCVVLDFGMSLSIHGSLEQEPNIDGQIKVCPECFAQVPKVSKECLVCGYVWPPVVFLASDPDKEVEPELRGELREFVMTEIDLLNDSPFRYEDIFNGVVCIASAMDAWVAVIAYYGRWHAIGGGKEAGMHHLANSDDRFIAMASADDFLRLHGDKAMAGKAKRWLTEQATVKQLGLLGLDPLGGAGMTKYQAACRLEWKFHERAIKAILERAGQRMAA